MTEPEDIETGEMMELPEDDVTVTDTEDGGAVISYTSDEEAAAARKHFANLADVVDRGTLNSVVTDLIEKVRLDKEAREKRDKLYEEGLKRTGLANDAPGGATFSGASRVVHPVLIEACVDFSARVMKEIFPPAGPVKSKVVGRQDISKLDKAQRKTDFMNWQLTELLKEFRGELEQLSTQLPLGGVQYLKFIWDDRLRRPVTEFIPVDDMVLPFAATNFYTAERRTHIQYLTEQRYRERVRSGMYLDVDLPAPDDPEYSRSEQANQKIEGKTATSYNEDGLRTVLEISITLDIEKEDDWRPYIITIDKSTERVLSLYRNWAEEDDNSEELAWVVEFPFIPWRGSAPIGLTHMIGSLAGGATGALRALLDSAHINNIPGALRLKGGAQGQSLTVQPTEIVEIAGSGAVDDIRKLIMPLPFNPPSATLFQLLGFLVDAAKGVVQTSFEKLADGNPNAPVGTTLALIEQGMVVFSSIHSRLHAAMARCFGILHRLNASYLTDELLERYACGVEVSPEDFDGPLDVIPVGDPAIFSETQRFAQTQAVQQRAATVPNLYNARKVEEMFLRVLKINPDDVLVDEPGKENRDPVSENVAMTLGQPVYVLPEQDHLDHIKVLLGFLQSPLFGQNPAIVKTFLWPAAQHLRDHVLNYYLSQCHTAIAKAKEEGLPVEDSSQEVDIILRVQQAVEMRLAQFTPMLAQIDAAAQQYKPEPQMPPDNSLQIAQMSIAAQQQKDAQDAQLKTQALQAKAQSDAQSLQQKTQALQLKAQTDAQALQLKTQTEEKRLTLDERLAQIDAQMRATAEQNRVMLEQLRQSAENQRLAETNASKERMNTADNETATAIAAAEIATGDKVGVSTGSGINPNP